MSSSSPAAPAIYGGGMLNKKKEIHKYIYLLIIYA